FSPTGLQFYFPSCWCSLRANPRWFFSPTRQRTQCVPDVFFKDRLRLKHIGEKNQHRSVLFRVRLSSIPTRMSTIPYTFVINSNTAEYHSLYVCHQFQHGRVPFR